MADYSDGYAAEKWNEHARIRKSIIARFQDNGYNIVWKDRGYEVSWAADHIAHLECQWCGVLVWDSRLHRRYCIAPLAADPDIEPPPPPVA